MLLADDGGAELVGVLVALAAVLTMLEVRPADASVSLRVRSAVDAASVGA